MSIGEGFSMGGFWMYILTGLAIALVALVVVQIRRIRTANYTPVLWGGLLAVLCCGFLGTTIGITQAGLAIGEGKVIGGLAGGAACPACTTLAKALGVAMTPGSYSMIIVFVLAIVTGVVHYRIKAARAGS